MPNPISLRLPRNVSSAEGQAIHSIREQVFAEFALKTAALDNTLLGALASDINSPSYKYVGMCVFSATSNKPLWWSGTAWVDATGIAIVTPA